MLILIRTCPFIPFSIFNYLLGVTSINVNDFMIALFGILPEKMMVIYVGLTLENIAEYNNNNNSSLQMFIAIFGSISLVVIIIYVTHTV